MLIKNISNIVNNKIDCNMLNNSNYISTENMLENFGGIKDASNVPSGKCTAILTDDILLSNIRPYFKKLWFSKLDGGCSNDVIALRVNNKLALSKYVFYALSSNKFFDVYVANCKGTKMPRGNKDVLLNYDIPTKSLSEQQHIVDTIGTVDNLIENYELQIARFKLFSDSVYKQYCEKENELSVLNLGDCCEIKTGKLNANEGSENGIYPFFTCSQTESNIDNFAFDTKAIIIAGNGDISVKYYEGKFNAYQRTYVLTPTKYLCLFLKECENNISELKSASRGSVIKFITKDMLCKIKIKIFDNAEIINNKLQEIYNNIMKLNIKIKRLKDIKNQLLHKYFGWYKLTLSEVLIIL